MIHGSQIAVPLHCKSGGSYLREHSSSITEISDFRHEPAFVPLSTARAIVSLFALRSDGLQLIYFMLYHSREVSGMETSI